MKAVIMAGGEGSRLRPLTCNRPKPMVPIVNRPVMEHIIELLKKYGINEIAVTLQYMPEIIKDYFSDGSEYGVNLKYYTEEVPLGTAGSVKNAEDFLDETFIVISGDALTDIDLDKAVKFHKENHSMATLVLKKVENPVEYGVVVTDKSGRITRFLEKPSWGEVFSDTVNTGIYILSPEVLRYFEPNQVFDFSKDLFPILLKENRPMYGFVTENYWCDIGDLEAYTAVHTDILNGLVDIKIDAREIRQGVWVSEGAVIARDAIIKPPVLIGKYASIQSGSTVERYSVVGEGCNIHEGSSIKRSVLWKGCVLKRNTQLRGCVLCDRVQFKERASAFEGAVIGDNCLLEQNTTIKPGVKLWPGKNVESETEINTNLVWGSRYSRNLFGNRGILGELNNDITPEFISRLGAAYGAICSKGAKIGVCCDDSDSLKMLKGSLISGLLSSGAEVYDLGFNILPVTRSAISFYSLAGGVHLSSVSEESGKIAIEIINQFGNNITRNEERKVENLFSREDFIRCPANEIKPVTSIPDHSMFYIQWVLNSVASEKLDFKMALMVRSSQLRSILCKIFDGVNVRYEFIDPDMELGTYKRKKSFFSNLKSLTSSVKYGSFDMGVYFHDSYEKMILLDTKGRVIADDLYTALISLIHLKHAKGNKVVVPLNTSTVIEQIALQNDGSVIRTKTSRKELMNRISDEYKDGVSNYFDMNFDSIVGLIKILDFMKINNCSLSKLVDMIPNFHILKKEVKCPWSAKGKVIRSIIEENESNVETMEGVKVLGDKGWVLVLPDAERPVCKVIGEGYSEEYANELTDIYVEKVKAISRNNEAIK